MREEKRKARYEADGDIWRIPCQLALSCATQNELAADGVRALLANGCIALASSEPPATTSSERTSPGSCISLRRWWRWVWFSRTVPTSSLNRLCRKTSADFALMGVRFSPNTP